MSGKEAEPQPAGNVDNTQPAASTLCMPGSTRISNGEADDSNEPDTAKRDYKINMIAWHGTTDRAEDSFLKQIMDIPSEAESLILDEEVPSTAEFEILGERFPNIRRIEINSGFNESMNDDFPYHWPLDTIILGSACGETFQSPFILEGRCRQLILQWTHGLRFEGPSTQELINANQGNDEPDPDSGVTLTFVPELTQNWQLEHWKDKSLQFPLTSTVDYAEHIKMTHLLIHENNSMETFMSFAMARPHVTTHLTHLIIRSTNGCDWQSYDPNMFKGLLPHHTNLTHLSLAIAELQESPEYLHDLHASFPPNLQNLHFRGPTNLTKAAAWKDWVAKFRDATFLPELKELAFVLDMKNGPSKYGGWQAQRDELEAVQEANKACREIWRVAKERGVEVVPWKVDRWCGQHDKGVDERWDWGFERTVANTAEKHEGKGSGVES